MIKRIMLFTYGDQSHENTIAHAVRYAKKIDAEVTGLFVKPDYLQYSTLYGEYPLNLAKTIYDRQQSYSDDNKAVFESTLKKFGCKGEWHDVERYEAGPNPALYSDCIFVSQPQDKSSTLFSETDFVDALIMNTGIPVIIVPKDWQGTEFATRPLLGWKESKEATNAVRHAMPFMLQANDVDIVSVSNSKTPEDKLIHGIQISEYLSLHGVSCGFYDVREIDIDVNEADSLLRYAEDNKRDLIIVGGYSHTRFREIVLGGVTRRLLRTSTLPVLFAH